MLIRLLRQKIGVIVRPFTLKQYDDITDILNALREGYTIAVIDIKQLRTKDVIELKRLSPRLRKLLKPWKARLQALERTLLLLPLHLQKCTRLLKKTDSGSGKKDSLEFY